MTTITFIQNPAEILNAVGEVRAGGTDLQARRRTGVADGPLIDINAVAGLDQIEWDTSGLVRIGALVKIDTLARHATIQQHYPGLALAAAGLATPQIRLMGTVGGNLLQRTRCWYFRHPAFACFKKGGNACPARAGHHEFGVCFDRGPCVYPHPSTLGMALLAYDAQVEVQGSALRSVAELYGDGSDPQRDHLLGEHELLTAIRLPAPAPGERAAYFRSISRAEAEWPLGEALVRLVLDDNNLIQLARVSVGGVANIPLRLPQVEAALIGQAATAVICAQAAELAAAGANPLPQTVYKVKLLVGTVLETLERAINM